MSPLSADPASLRALLLQPRVIVPAFICLVTTVVGALCLRAFVSLRRKVVAARQWPIADGEVMATSVVERRSSGKGHVSYFYYPHVEYRYRHAGMLHNADALRFVKVGYGRRQTAEEIVERYPIGSKVRVHVNPDNATESVLDLESDNGLPYLIVGVIFTLVGLGLGCLVFLFVRSSGMAP